MVATVASLIVLAISPNPTSSGNIDGYAEAILKRAALGPGPANPHIHIDLSPGNSTSPPTPSWLSLPATLQPVALHPRLLSLRTCLCLPGPSDAERNLAAPAPPTRPIHSLQPNASRHRLMTMIILALLALPFTAVGKPYRLSFCYRSSCF